VNKIAASLLLAFASTAGAVDSFDAKTNMLTLSSVQSGGAIFKNVAVKLNNFSVLGYDPNPATGLALYEDNRLRIELAGSSRGSAAGTGAAASSAVSLSVLVINKTAARLLITGANDAGANRSVLADEKGGSCVNASLLGINTVGSANSNPGQYTGIAANGKKVLGFNSGCLFKGALFSYDAYLWVYDESAASAALVTFGFADVAIPN
jgi:hypothetical protein